MPDDLHRAVRRRGDRGDAHWDAGGGDRLGRLHGNGGAGGRGSLSHAAGGRGCGGALPHARPRQRARIRAQLFARQRGALFRSLVRQLADTLRRRLVRRVNEAVDLLAAINADRSLGSEVLFSHRHTHASAPMHVEINDLWSCADENVLIEAFREGGKTTAAEEWLCMAAHFGNFYYCLLIGETYEKACTRLAEVSKEARQNERLHRLFGKSMVARSIENMLFFSNGRLIHALGWDQELQSFKHDGHRPDLCFFDDPENKERVRDAAAVDESMRKLYLELIPA